MTIKVLDQEAKRELSKSPEKLRKSMTIKQLEEEKVSAKFTSEIHIDPKKSFITQDFKSTPRKKKQNRFLQLEKEYEEGENDTKETTALNVFTSTNQEESKMQKSASIWSNAKIIEPET